MLAHKVPAVVRFIRKKIHGRWVLVAVFALSCTGSPSDVRRTSEVYIPMDASSTADEEWEIGQVAYAAPEDPEPPPLVMPENASHISMTFPKTAPQLMVAMLSGASFPYQHVVIDRGDRLTLTVYLPPDQEISLAVYPANEEGEAIGEASYYTFIPRAQLGTQEDALGQSHLVVDFQTGAETALQLGDNLLDKPATNEFVAGNDRNVFHGILNSERNMICRVSWDGAPSVYVLCDGIMEHHTESFVQELMQGKKYGFYPVISEEDLDAGIVRPVNIRLEELQ